MKNVNTYLITSLIVSALAFSCNSTEKNLEKNYDEVTVQKNSYDSTKAKAYGADKYGMKKYVIAFLKRGPNRDRDSSEVAALQKAHLDNINKMVEARQLVLAGPFFGDGDLRGIYVFNVQSIAEAEALTNTDPAVQAGSLVMELKEWYGSAALMEVKDIHSTIAEEEI